MKIMMIMMVIDLVRPSPLPHPLLLRWEVFAFVWASHFRGERHKLSIYIRCCLCDGNPLLKGSVLWRRWSLIPKLEFQSSKAKLSCGEGGSETFWCRSKLPCKSPVWFSSLDLRKWVFAPPLQLPCSLREGLLYEGKRASKTLSGP